MHKTKKRTASLSSQFPAPDSNLLGKAEFSKDQQFLLSLKEIGFAQSEEKRPFIKLNLPP